MSRPLPAVVIPDLTIGQTAAALNTSVSTVYRLIAAGKLHTYQLGGRQRVTQAELARVRSGGDE